MFKPKLWLWWRIRAARKRVKQANAQLEAVDLDSVLSEGQRRIDNLGLREDELKLLLQQKLIFAARRWGVFVPYSPASWPKQAYKGRASSCHPLHLQRQFRIRAAHVVRVQCRRVARLAARQALFGDPCNHAR